MAEAGETTFGATIRNAVSNFMGYDGAPTIDNSNTYGDIGGDIISNVPSWHKVLMEVSNRHSVLLSVVVFRLKQNHKDSLLYQFLRHINF